MPNGTNRSAGEIHILGMRVDPTSYQDATAKILSWAERGESRYVCVANVHMVMEAYDDPRFRRMVNESDLVTPDGMPLVWMMRLLGKKGQERVYGPELTLRVLEAAAEKGIPVGFYGSSPEVLENLVNNLRRRYTGLRVVYAHSPPYRELSAQEEEEVVRSIRESGAKILFVGLGCPKQERWMANHKGKIDAVMVGVGAAFDFHAGRVRQAPPWMQRMGLEWLFRLLMEPRRLWKRYAKHNPRFVALAALQLIGVRRYDTT